ncbi:MAG TPA: N-acetylmuramoyl-L-alanine amidase, partial [Chloroflexota bacterium]|nr:N-acetylmuramoyl-L-alanine amidase [Chloroflexota bacterium]
MRPSRPLQRRQPARLLVFAAILVLAASSLVAILLRRSQPVEAIGNRSEFASSACIAYSPTAHDRHRTVFVDPGHGGADPGAAGVAPDGRILYEKDLTLPVALDMLAALRADGYRVVLSRTQDSMVAAARPGYLSGG